MIYQWSDWRPARDRRAANARPQMICNAGVSSYAFLQSSTSSYENNRPLLSCYRWTPVPIPRMHERATQGPRNGAQLRETITYRRGNSDWELPKAQARSIGLSFTQHRYCL